MRLLLDTNVLSENLRGNTRARDLILDEEHELFVCAPVQAELLYGAIKRNNLKLRRDIERMLGAFPSLEFEARAALEFAQARVYLEQEGKMIGAFDLLIAAIALANELGVATFNAKEFSRVPGLGVLDLAAAR